MKVLAKRAEAFVKKFGLGLLTINSKVLGPMLIHKFINSLYFVHF